jgi:hypothetical protein
MNEELLKMIEESAKKLGCGKGELLHEFCILVEKMLKDNIVVFIMNLKKKIGIV